MADGLLNKASIILTPTGYKAGTLYNVAPIDEPYEDFDFARTSTATRINSSGLVSNVATGVPRINYDSNGDNGHILLEPTSTNLITYSEDFTDSSWTKSNVTITSNSIISPDGSLNASLMTISGGASDQRISSNISYSGTNTVSIFAKASNSNWLSIRIGSSVNKWYDLENGVLGGSTITTAYVDADIQDFGNGWYRCILVFTDNDTLNTRIYPAENNLDVTHTSGSVYIWGCQAEALSYATSYIPTLTGSQETRATETATGAGSATLINSTEGVLYAEIAALADDNTYRVLSLSDGTTNERVYMQYTNASNTVSVVVKDGGVTQANMVYVLSDATNFSKVAIKYKSNDFALWVDGVERATDTSGNTPTGLNTLAFNSGGSAVFYGKCKALAVFNEALSDSELTQLTT
jgi:hypothetical protein